MMGGIERRVARLEQGASSGLQDLAAILDAGRAEMAAAIRSGTHLGLEARHRSRRRDQMVALDAIGTVRRLKGLESRMQDGLRRVEEAVHPTATRS